MARRRKNNNKLLTKIFLVTLVAHAIALPIAAHYGAFKNIRRGPGDARIVMLAPNLKDQPDKPKEKAKEKPKQVKDTKKSNSGVKSSNKGNNLPQPKVVTSGPASGSGDGSGGPTAESGTGTAGKLPTDGKATQPKTEITEPKKDSTPTPTTNKKPDTSKVDTPKSDPVKTPEPKAKKVIEAVVAEAPQPEIPDELRSEPLDKELVVEAKIDTGGHPIEVTVVTSTGIKELDRIGLETAKKYRFKPATIDGVASEQNVRFKIYFKVD